MKMPEIPYFPLMDRFCKYKLDHAAFWTATVGFHMFTRLDLIASAGWHHFLLETIVRNGLLAVLIYFNLLVLIPRYARRKKHTFYILSLLTGLGAYVLLKNAHDVYLFGYVLDDPAQQSFLSNTYYNFSIAIFYLAFSIALHFSKAWYFQQELMRKMETEKLNAELDYLKAQINPHFVFNSLNAIYFQIDKQNEAARRSLSDFSDMLRYQLYECNGAEIPIEKEVSYLENYVALQRMRKDGNYNISFVRGDGLHGFSIAPLLLIQFVENAFKHVSHFSSRNQIRIALQRCGEEFHFSVFNTREKKEGTDHAPAGIGLKNVKRRLELLYKDEHTLRMDKDVESFEVNLSLKIRETVINDHPVVNGM